MDWAGILWQSLWEVYTVAKVTVLTVIVCYWYASFGKAFRLLRLARP